MIRMKKRYVCFLTPVLTGSSDEGQQPVSAASQQMAPLARLSIIFF